MTTAPAITADTLRFVRTCDDLARAIAQRDGAAARLPKKEAHAVQAGNPAIAEVARETLAAWTFRVGELGGAVEVQAEAAPVKTAKPMREATDPCRVKAMRRFYAVAKAAGLDLKEVQKMKAALSKYLGRPVPSRRDLSAGQWAEVSAAIELELLAW